MLNNIMISKRDQFDDLEEKSTIKHYESSVG